MSDNPAAPYLGLNTSMEYTMNDGDPTPECLKETSRLRVKDLQCMSRQIA